jgi:hypothetical protein
MSPTGAEDASYDPPMEETEVIFEPGAVVVVESIHGSLDGLAVELQLERYEPAEGVARVCATEADVRALLVEVGVSTAKADVYAPALWREMFEVLQSLPPPPEPLPPHRLP